MIKVLNTLTLFDHYVTDLAGSNRSSPLAIFGNFTSAGKKSKSV